MESLSELLSPYDDLEILCEEHGIPCIGLCSDNNCKEETRFLCMRCVKSGNTCITEKKHELITLAEMLYRFFIKEENNSIYLLNIQTMNQIISEYKKGELNNVLNEFKKVKNESSLKINDLQTLFLDLINNFMDSFKAKNKEKLDELKNISKKNEENEKDIQFLLNIKIPEFDKKNMDNNQKLLDFMNNGYKLSSPKNFINSVKLLNDSKKFLQT